MLNLLFASFKFDIFENMDPSCVVSMVQAGGGGVMVEMFSWHPLGLLIPINHRLNAAAYLTIVADHLLSQMA
uniref:Uncharacterized protein n=1 Tax=Pygocentrus nattereri TaxID=42514 RepID=A0AAR2J0L9_PYGNA